ncbi:hypothetical protein [Phytopseudomonas dryadis]|uniref:Uncharacterized protein n=1 Tax=Phytopseudomonas dryadis TaxID=2487520 RepID=A0ABY1Z153_9GAMM|nr:MULTISPECIES: hypothetical protein [Pseudomonas]TBV01348.1 hypothetical protein DNK34_21150 [Pseudomonas dryadis]TBV14103.1 hypothetical protein DNK41_20745 [Pseudomonas sp. FRB 230]
MPTCKHSAASDDRDTRPALPAMPPLGLLQWLGDWYFAWRWRRQMRRLLMLESRGLVRLGSARERVRTGAGMTLRMIAARHAGWRRKSEG